MSADNQTVTPPREAFQFLAPAQFAPTKDDKENRKFSGVAYGGGEITDHPFWDKVVFDLSDARAQSQKVPILLDHDTRQRAGFAAITIGQDITAHGELLPNAFGASIATEADAGFPWQMSVGVFPARIDQLQAGATETINGRQVTGPAHVFRGTRIREVSFVAMGADAGTSASVFAGLVKPPSEGDSMSDPKGLEARITELEASLKASNEAFEAEKAARVAADQKLTDFAAATRKAQVAELFVAMGRKPEDESIKPYLEMSDATFAAVSADLQASKSKLPAGLFSTQATDGEDHKAINAEDLALKAQQFQAEAKARGQFVSISQAVNHVQRAASTSAEG